MTPSLVAFFLSWAAAKSGISSSNGIVERTLRKFWGRLELNNAVLACEPGDPWIRRLLELSLEQNPSVRFALGPGLVNLGWDLPGGAKLPMRSTPEVFYQFPPSQTVRYFRGSQDEMPANAAVLHWCSSNHTELVSRLTPDLLEKQADRGPWFRAAKRCMDKSKV